MVGGRFFRRRWATVLASGALTASVGCLTLLGTGAAAPPVATTMQMVPVHLARVSGPTARSSTTTASASPCWASSNWSGYAVSESSPAGLPCVPASNTAYTNVTGTWTVPKVTSSRFWSTYSAAWTGIDGFTNSSLIQVGTEQDYSFFGGARYSAWWEILPAAETVIPSISVQPGDSITASITKVPSTGLWSITLTDNGKGGHAAQKPFTISKAYSGPGTSAEWVVEAPEVNGRVATLAPYGSTVFDSGTVNGGPVSLVAGAGGEVIQGNAVVSIPSAPDTAIPVGDGFAIAYGSTAPSAPPS